MSVFWYISRSVSESDLSSGSQPHEFTKEPPSVDRKTVIKPTVVEKLDTLRQIRSRYMRSEISSSEEEKDTPDSEQQRSLSISLGKRVDFKCMLVLFFYKCEVNKIQILVKNGSKV